MSGKTFLCCGLTAMLLLMVCAISIEAQDRSGTTLSTSKSTGEVAEIDRYAAGLDEYTRSHPAPDRVFGDVSSGITDETAKWQVFPSVAEREQADTGENMNRSADVWRTNGKVTVARFIFQSPSRDWVNFVTYYFRSDGTLAKSHSRLNTTYGDISVVREDYYNRKGRLLKGTTHCSDLKTQQPTPCGEFSDRPAPVYQKTSALPFSGQLKK